MGRRIQKVVNGVTNTYVYDGWLLVSEGRARSPSEPGVTNYYTWGPDLSGTLQGAGGIGGLLSVTIISNGTASTYYPLADGNGNITDYLDTNGVVVAHREYDPFGRTVLATGPMVNEFHFWFSSKYLDSETGLYYYGFRFYSPELGRWPSRDPMEEIGGFNLYLHCQNDAINRVDALGLLDSVTASFWNAMAAGNYTEAAAILEVAEGTLSKQAIATLAAALAAAVAGQGLIDHMNDHISAAMSTCPGLSPDPKDPKHDPFKHWMDEIKAAVKNLKQYLKKLPNNAAKRKPVEDAIKQGEEFLKKVQEAASKPCPSCEGK
jgi:RHS repeat-associated protein